VVSLLSEKGESESREMYNIRLLNRLISFALIALILVGCGGAAVEPTVSPTLPPKATPLSPVKILESSFTAMDELDSYHFAMITHQTVVSEGTTQTRSPLIFTGDFKAPDRFRGEMKLELVEFSLEIEIIMIGESIYIKESTSGEWQMSAEPVMPFTPEDFIGFDKGEISNMEGLTLLRETILDGVPVYRIEGKLSIDAMEAVLGEFGKNTVVYWIGVEDGWVRQVDFEMELFPVDDEIDKMRVRLIINFSEFNREISIEAP
jgi:hypothetical protein